MALPWSTLVKAIPWSDVIARAPDLAQSARKLWQKAAPQGAPADTANPPNAATPDAARLAALARQLDALSLQQQEAAGLLAALATQNAELVDITHRLQQRVRQLGIALALAGVLAAAALGMALLGHR